MRQAALRAGGLREARRAAPAPSPAVQRRPVPGAGQCLGNQARLRKQSAAPLRLQTKLEVGAANDPLEHEADRVADQVMRMPDPAFSVSDAPLGLARQCTACGEEEQAMQRMPAAAAPAAASAGAEAAGDVAPVVAHGTSGGGHALDPETRTFMEARFGHQFAGVRLHTDAAAAHSARAVQARAYTVGNQIVFGAGHYAPKTAEGRRLIAHELAHTVQQGGAAPASVSRSLLPRLTAGAGNIVRRIGECADKSYRDCSGSCVPADGRGTGFCAWSGSIKTGCICYRRDQPMLRELQQFLFNLMIAALIAAGIVLTIAAIAAIIACLSGPCEVAALIAAVGYAGAMIVLGIIRSHGGSGSGAGPTAQADGVAPAGGGPAPDGGAGAAPAPSATA